VLLDTHAFLWFVTDDPQLSTAARAVIVDSVNQVLVSPASYWEIAIKVRLGKYLLSVPYLAFITEGIEGNDFQALPVEPRHTDLLTTMPFHHRDPFDRLLVAQGLAEAIPLVSGDARLDAYRVDRLW
jgi:PIN domain nuclease of toxin-antitoxin system